MISRVAATLTCWTYESVESAVRLSIEIAALFFGIFNSRVNEMRIVGFVGGGKDQGGVCGGILD